MRPSDSRSSGIPPGLRARFSVRDRLGGGATGDVLLADDAALGRTVVLKLVRLDGVAEGRLDELAERVLQEARILAGLRHPHIVTLLDFGRSGNTLYLVYPDGAGRDLMSVAPSRGRWSAEAVRRLLDEVLDALELLHEHDVVHRDLKPANVLQLADGRYQLIDLGLAKDMVRGQDLTATDSFLGTPLFASPEQVTGEDPDPRDDLYSLGVLAYQLLAGRNPFAADSLQEVLRRQLGYMPPPLHETSSLIPESLSRFVAELMAKDREDRPATAAAARARLSLLLAGPAPSGEGTVVLPPAAPDPAPGPARDAAPAATPGAPLMAALALLALLALAAPLGKLGGRPGPPPPAPPASRDPTPRGADARRERDQALAAASRALGALEQADRELRQGAVPPHELATLVRLEGLLGGPMTLARLGRRAAETASGRAALADWLAPALADAEAAVLGARRALAADPGEADEQAVLLAGAFEGLELAFHGSFADALVDGQGPPPATPAEAFFVASLLARALDARGLQGERLAEGRARERRLWRAAVAPGRSPASTRRAGAAALGWIRSLARAGGTRENLLRDSHRTLDAAGVRQAWEALAPHLAGYEAGTRALILGEVLRVDEKARQALGLGDAQRVSLERAFRAARAEAGAAGERALQEAFPRNDFLGRLPPLQQP